MTALAPVPRVAVPMAPLALDLDGTLLRTDSLMETLVAFVRGNPLGVLAVFWWFIQGRSVLKRKLAERVAIDADLWPVHEGLVTYAKNQAAQGRLVVLATAADRLIAEQVKARFPFIAEIIASDGGTNLKGRAKARALEERFPEGFVYAGDSRADLEIWHRANGSIFVGAKNGRATSLARAAAPSEAEFVAEPASSRVWIKALRLHQWAKNALIFVPLVLGGGALEAEAWLACALGFLSIGIIASSSYLLNDLVDIDDDRRHWSKQHRPFASGLLPIAYGLAIVPFGMVAGLGLAYLGAGWPGVAAVTAYLAITLAYSFGLKRIPLVDAFTLATLFTARLVIGIVFANVAPSAWFLVFSMFVFTSLSLAKRTTEIQRMVQHGLSRAIGRGYDARDLATVSGFGIASATAALLILVLYLIEEAFTKTFYGFPEVLWALPCILAVWLARIWLLCGRGELEDDPVAFAVRDRVSRMLGVLKTIVLIAALGVQRLAW